MKLAPREHRVRADYLVDNASALKLGQLYLGWNRRRSHKKRRAHDAKRPRPQPTLPRPAVTTAARGGADEPRDKATVAPRRRRNKDDMLTTTIRLINGRAFTVRLPADATVAALKRALAQETRSLPSLLVMAGRPLLPDGANLRALGLHDGAVVYGFPPTPEAGAPERRAQRTP